jgi:hypothetical protein
MIQRDSVEASVEQPIVATDGSIRKAVMLCLDDFGYDFLTTAAGNDIRFESVVEKGKPTWRSQILIDEEHRLVRLFVFLTDELYPDYRRLWVAELAGRTSDALAIGSIEFDWDTGSAHFRNSLDLRSGNATADDIATRLLNPSSFAIRLWDRGYQNVNSSKISARQALKAALISLDAHENGDVKFNSQTPPLTLVK